MQRISKENYLLTTLSEECGELVESVLYFNREEQDKEFNDLMGVIELLKDEKIINHNALDNLPIDETVLRRYGNLKKIGFVGLVLKLQYFTHKATRFGVQDIKENSAYTNEQEILIIEQIINISFFDRFKSLSRELMDKKKEKVLKFMHEYGIK